MLKIYLIASILSFFIFAILIQTSLHLYKKYHRHGPSVLMFITTLADMTYSFTTVMLFIYLIQHIMFNPEATSIKFIAVAIYSTLSFINVMKPTID